MDVVQLIQVQLFDAVFNPLLVLRLLFLRLFQCNLKIIQSNRGTGQIRDTIPWFNMKDILE